MKIFYAAIILFATLTISAQTLPFSFEGDITTADFVDFDGGVGTVISNPQSGGINTSAMVAQIVRDGGMIWSGSKIVLDNNLNFEVNSAISFKVYTSAPVGTTVKLKLENITGGVERDAITTTTSEWEVLTWDFTGIGTDFNTLAFMFDYGNIGNGSATSTFLFDDAEQIYIGEQIDFPVNFEGDDVNYTVTDFGGTISTMVKDPTNDNNTVIKTVKPLGAATWAGTTIGTNAGFKTKIPLTLDKSVMSVYVWSPKAGTPIRLKVEDWKNPRHTCETQTTTTLDGEWEVIEFDFVNQAPGTELLSVGLEKGWVFNMASIFFNFDTDGNTAGEQTYYFDDVTFGELIVGFEDPKQLSTLQAFPVPATNNWTITSGTEVITQIEIFNINGQSMGSFKPRSVTAVVDVSAYNKGVYLSRITTQKGIEYLQLIKK